MDGKTLATLFDVTISNYSPVNPVPESVLAGIHGGEVLVLVVACADRVVLMRAAFGDCRPSPKDRDLCGRVRRRLSRLNLLKPSVLIVCVVAA